MPYTRDMTNRQQERLSYFLAFGILFWVIVAVLTFSYVPLLPAALCAVIVYVIGLIAEPEEKLVAKTEDATVTESMFFLDEATGEIIERPVTRRVVHFE